MIELEERRVASCRCDTGDHPVSNIGIVVHGESLASQNVCSAAFELAQHSTEKGSSTA